ncbi:hypothetical protein INT44_002470 [Umbelopsis vinacea]|uniref:GH16 domain-containing protein n=1 Tax=Umbelopsis vinacea TaxID=44442 RepID=A0A8H7UL21_9FUNG|nr:hypothetical protein INT44_002470 [Umbelopsis vinacea]
MARILVTTSIIFTALSTLVRADIPTGTNGFSLVWGDDFNGGTNTAVNSNNWQFDLGTGYPGGASNWGTGELEINTNDIENCYQDGNGNLRIAPVRDSSGGWTSARIESVRDDFQAPPGGVMAIEAKIQLPNVSGDAAAGYFPAFWMLGTPFRNNYNNWPEVGEFDIMENVNGINKVFGTLHCGNSPGGNCNESNGLGGSLEGAYPPLQEDYHIYRFEWDDGQQELRWYLDGQQFWTVDAATVTEQTWQDFTSHPYFIILNVAIGGGFPSALGGGPTDATESGAPMLVDYVAVYEKEES